MPNTGAIDSTIAGVTQAAIVEASLILVERGTLRDTIVNKQVPQGKNAVSFPAIDKFTAEEVADGTDLTTVQDADVTEVTLTPTTKGVLTHISDMADLSAPADFGGNIGRQIGNAIVELQNANIWDLFAAFDKTATGDGATTNITESIILSAVQQLEAAGAPHPYFLPCTSHIYADILTIYSTNTNFTTDQLRNLALEGKLPPIYGITPLLVTNLPSSIHQAASVSTGLYSPFSMGFASLRGVQIENERNASLRSTELVGTSIYAVGIVRNDWGVEIELDNNDAC